jgi:type IV pilus assembly protein PilM
MLFATKTAVGLDVGSSLVKAAQLRKSGKAIELEKLGVAEIYPGGDKKAATEDVKQLKIKAIRRALEAANIKAKHSISAVSGESIIVRYMQLPDMPEDELKNALRWEAEEYIPFRIDEVNLDSVILGKSGGTAAGKVDVLLVSAKKDLINEHLELIRGAGLTPMIVDVDGFAFLNCFEANYEPSPTDVVTLVNIGAEVTSINVYVNGYPRFSRDISSAGDSITNAIQSKLGIDFTRAESLKITEGAPFEAARPATGAEEESSLIDTVRATVERITGEDLGDDSQEAIAARSIRNTLNNLLSEIKRSIQFFENQPGGKRVQRIVVGGGTAKLKNLDKFFSKELALPVEIIDPLRRISITGKDIDQRTLETYRTMATVSIGLALRKVTD